MSHQKSQHLLINETPFQAVRQPLRDLSITFPPNSRWTKQSFAAECDINTIMARYQSTGEMPVINQLAPQYLDATGFDYQTMQNQIVEANQLFSQLPSALRARFQNDPGQFIDYCHDPENLPEMRKLGLVKDLSTGPAPYEAGTVGKSGASEGA